MRGSDFTTEGGWGVPSYTINVSPQLILTSLKAPYQNIHSQLGPFDPYTDVFFAFSPGLGFPSQPTETMSESALEEGKVTLDRAEEIGAFQSGSTAAGAAGSYSPAEVDETAPATSSAPAQPTVQAQTTWRQPLQQILKTKCAIFFTAFSPTDLSRDVSALSGAVTPSFPFSSLMPSASSTKPATQSQSGPSEFPTSIVIPDVPTPIEGITDEFELILTPGKNWFGSEKWEIAEWDSRVGVRTNWGVWGIRGKKYEVVREEDATE